MTTIICDHCQAKNEAGTRECVACGRPLADGGTAARSPGEAEQAPPDKEGVERWLGQLPDWTRADAERTDGEDESLPAWLHAVRVHADDLTDEEADELMEFLRELEPADGETPSEPPAEESAVQARMTADLPDWVAALEPEEQRRESEADEQLSEDPAEVEEADDEPLPSTSQLPGTQPLQASGELEGIPERLASQELPEWLADQEGVQAPSEATEQLPEWPTSSAKKPMYPAPEPVTEDARSEDVPPDSGDLEQALAAAAANAAAESPQQAVADGSADDSGAADLEQALAAAMVLPEGETSQERVDQWLDLLENLPATEDPDQLEKLMLDSDVEGAELPDWLRAMRPHEDSGRPESPQMVPPEETGPLAGLSGIVPAAVIGVTGDTRRTAARLEMSKEQRQQAALLRQLTTIESEQALADESAVAEPFLAARTILGLALLLAIILGWLLPNIADFLPWSVEPTVPPAAEQAWQSIEANGGQTALVAFEYTPSMAGELDSVAAAVLEHLAQNGSQVLTISQIAAGVPMADQATADVQDLRSSSLGYLPGEATGLRALGACLAQPCDSLVNGPLNENQQDALADVGLIVVLSADRDSLVGWVEQVGTQTDSVMIAGVTQALGPVARPYLASDQFAGLIEGMPVAAAYAKVNQAGDDVAAEHLTALTLAQWLVIVALLAGAIYFGLAAPAASAVTQAAKK